MSYDHFWTCLPAKYESAKYIRTLCDKLTKYYVCTGNFDYYLVPIGCGINSKEDSSPQGYREGNFGVSDNATNYASTIRNVSCKLLDLTGTGRCGPCKKIRSLLYMGKYRKELKEKYIGNRSSELHKLYKKHSDMSREELVLKLTQ